jgi:hypothetical protein
MNQEGRMPTITPLKMNPSALGPLCNQRGPWLNRRRLLTCALAVTMLAGGGPRAAAVSPQSFPTPQDAVAALGNAVNTTNRSGFTLLFGSESDWLANPDSVQGTRELSDFSTAFNATNYLVRDSETHMTLEVGRHHWPFPIPLVKTDRGWRFDTEAGREEILNRRIGRNELEALKIVRAYVAAQREYALKDRDGDGVLEYAQTLTSSPGLTDGLYWPPELTGEISPLGPLVAEAQDQGYFRANSAKPQPFYGYFFKVLKQQGKHAPGGKYDYVINGNMIGGFALAAWPAEYGESGIMTFIVNQQGRVYEKDLGPKTAKAAEKLQTYDPDPTWTLSPD